MASVKSWIQAFRLRTLPLALSGIGMGSVLAYYHHSFKWEIFILTFLTTLFLQILSNLANDYGDSQNGADHQDRKGPSRAVQSGAISAKSMKIAILICALLALTSGLILLFRSLHLSTIFWLFLGLGLGAIVAAVKYTMGKNPYGYSGFGDLFVFIFFGLVSVIGTYFLYTNQIDWMLIFPAISCGLFAVAVLNVNNIRDIESDKQAGKRSIPVILGQKNAKIYHGLLLLIGLLSIVAYVATSISSQYKWLFLMTLPLFIKHYAVIYKGKSEEDFDPQLKKMALLNLQFVILFGISILY